MMFVMPNSPVWTALSVLISFRVLDSNAAPSGAITCSLPYDPERVIQYDYSDNLDSDIYIPGDYLVLECSEGFYTTVSDIECLKDGTWSYGTEDPRCQKIQCTAPDLPPNVRLENPQVVYDHLEKMRVTCELEDHVFEGYESPILSISCVGSRWGGSPGSWNKRLPPCQRIHCPYIPNPEDGLIVGQASTSYVGDSVSAECLRGHLKGNRTRWCTKYGTWTGSLQVCVSNNGDSGCMNPGTPIGGTKIGDLYDFGDIVTFKCDHDRTLLGSQSITCLQNREWSDTPPICRGRGEYLSEEEGTKGLRTFVDKKAEDTSSSQTFEHTLHKYKGKDVVINNINMKSYNPEARTPLRTFSKDGLDLFLLFDTSGSINQSDFQIALDLAKEVVKKLGVSRAEKGTTVSIIAFNTTVWAWYLAQPDDTVDSILDHLDQLGQNTPSGGTSIEAALRYLEDVLIPHVDQAALRPKAAYAVMVFTDGAHNTGQDPKKIVPGINNKYARRLEFFCIGVGNVELDELKGIASSSNPEHLIYLQTYSTLQRLNILFTSKTDFSICGEFTGYKNVFIEDVHGSKRFWPWMVGLFYTESDAKENKLDQYRASTLKCGATIIGKPGRVSSSWLLTAAHCLYDRVIEQFVVQIGSHSSNVHDFDDKKILTSIKRVILHPDYQQSTLENDIALIQLTEDIEFQLHIRPVCLPRQDQRDGYEVKRQGEVTGWGGETKDAKPVPDLKTIEVKVVDTAQCKTSMLNMGMESEVNAKWNFCAGNVTHREEKNRVQDSCGGDSGGPMVIHNENFIFTQTGIVSFGIKDCGKYRVPGVYTNVARFVTWIEENTKET